MRNLLLKIQYDGTNYQGWQTQKAKSVLKRKPTVQETIEKKLMQILQQKVVLQGSGRTDSGVHARAQYANFKVLSQIPAANLQKSLNALLPGDIRVSSVRDMRDDFHARFSAKSKVYRYTILNRMYNSVFLKNYVCFIRQKLDLEIMQKQAKIIKGRHDFKSFQASDKKVRPSVRTIKNISVKKRGSRIIIDVEADGFLYNMVRNIAGTLIEFGRGKLLDTDMKKILIQKDRNKAGPTASACGLCLLKVNY